MLKRLFRAAALPASLAALLTLNACGGSFGTEGQVRIVNATRAGTTLDLYAGTDRIAASIAAGNASGYVDLDEDSYTFNVKNSGSSSTTSSLSGTVDKESHYAVVAYATGGTLSTVYVDENEGAPSSGYAKLRVFNAASSEVDSVDVYLRSSACSGLSSSDGAFASAVTDLQDSYGEIGAGTYYVCVTGAGDKTDLRLEIPGLALANQQIATLILTNSTGGFLLDGLLLNQQGTLDAHANTSVRMRLVADATSSGVVTATANGTTLGASYSSPTVGGYKLVSAGDLTLGVSINGTAIDASGFSATAGSDVTLLVAGGAASPTVVLLNDDNTPSTSSTKPVRIRLVNGLNGISGSAMLTVDGDVIADSIAFGAASTSVSVASSAAAAQLEVSLAGTTLWAKDSQTLTSGKVYTVFLLGDASGTVTGTLRADR